MVFLKDFFEKLILQNSAKVKNQPTTKKHGKLPRMQSVNISMKMLLQLAGLVIKAHRQAIISGSSKPPGKPENNITACNEKCVLAYKLPRNTTLPYYIDFSIKSGFRTLYHL